MIVKIEGIISHTLPHILYIILAVGQRVCVYKMVNIEGIFKDTRKDILVTRSCVCVGVCVCLCFIINDISLLCQLYIMSSQ